MDKFIAFIALPMMMGIIFYWLYINGYFVINAKRALVYVGSMGGRKASFTSCTGYTKRVVTFRETKTVNFHFDLELSKGEAAMELLDASKNCILRLDSSSLHAQIPIEAKKRYYLVFHFKSASGHYLLTWE